MCLKALTESGEQVELTKLHPHTLDKGSWIAPNCDKPEVLTPHTWLNVALTLSRHAMYCDLSCGINYHMTPSLVATKSLQDNKHESTMNSVGNIKSCV